ncbi:hypothetical protein [Hymenobacter montanus]|uniref:hypothetical protein n=1 Tax=Hymenobacter montanus TaxID=2771359 RepID=UPI00168AD4E5|nr:hypothetical protein [Hymenobacter montanus]
MTSYERLRILHRSLLRQPPSEAALRKLLASLPAYLDNIIRIRPALETEIDYGRQQLQRIQRRIAPGQFANTEAIAQGLHEALAPLFGS